MNYSRYFDDAVGRWIAHVYRRFAFDPYSAILYGFEGDVLRYRGVGDGTTKREAVQAARRNWHDCTYDWAPRGVDAPVQMRMF